MRSRILWTLCIALLAAPVALAQVEYENLDAGRPLRVEDAYAIERYGWDVQLGPAASWPASGTTSGVDAALAWGVLPRTQVELAVPFASVSGTSGASGIGLGALYNLNAETQSLPAFAVAARAVAPAGALAPPAALLTIEAIATRSWPGLRLNVNASATAGRSDTLALATDRTRWFAGAAVDHSWPLSSLLAMVQLSAEQPLALGSAVAWSAGAGARWQWTPRLVFDAGAERRFTGDAPAWSASLGFTWAFAVRALMPVPR